MYHEAVPVADLEPQDTPYLKNAEQAFRLATNLRDQQVKLAEVNKTLVRDLQENADLLSQPQQTISFSNFWDRTPELHDSKIRGWTRIWDEYN